MQQQLYHGAAYYPELWPREIIDEDLRYMKEAGINVVRMGEFAWSAMEPEPGRFTLDLFREVIARLHAEGIATVFCTPTPTPPIWFSHEHPERMVVDEDGHVMSHGSRQHCCLNSPALRERSRMITEAVARAVGRLPGVIAWQTDNEMRSHKETCYCASCRERWQHWLRERYGTIERLNDAWGAGVWSQAYQRFAQAPQPVATTSLHNASLVTAYRLFSRAMATEFQHEQVEIIRRYSDAPITHNTHRWHYLDHEQFFAELDFASFDIYAFCDDWAEMVCNYDLWRNVKPGRAFWMMETSTGYGGSLIWHGTPHRRGYLVAEAVSAYASGAQGFCYWLWRQQRSGSEITHGSVISAWGKPTAGYPDVLAVDEARRALEPYLSATAPAQAEVAMTYSDRARIFCSTESHSGDYLQFSEWWHARVLELGLHRDLIGEGHDLSGYKLFMTPCVPYLSPELLARALAFVEAGGIWLVGPMTGFRTAEHTVPTDAGLGPLEAPAGVETVAVYPMKDTGAVGSAFGLAAPLAGWGAALASRGAAVVGTIEGGLTPGQAFLTEQGRGAGKIVLLGAQPQGEAGATLVRAIIDHYAAEAGVTLRARTASGTVAIPRTGTDGCSWVVVNMDGRGGWVELPAGGTDLLNGEQVAAGRLAITPYAYRVLLPHLSPVKAQSMLK